VIVTEILANPLSQQLLTSTIPDRVAYSALDGDPRVVMRPHIGR
jgi:hypothetical protein